MKVKTYYEIWIGNSYEGASFNKTDIKERLDMYKKRKYNIELVITKLFNNTALDYKTKRLQLNFAVSK